MSTALQDISNETIELTKAAFAKTAGIEKAITTANGLVGYNLEAPAKKLYPVLSPLRNRIARTRAPVGSLAANWRAITAINSANVKAAVAFGTRNASTISYATANRAATYKTFGLDDSVDFEAVWLGRGFEDVRALSALSTLQATMIEEEKLILGGLGLTFTLGTTPTPSVAAAAASGGSNWTTNIYVRCMALPLYGYLNSTLTDLTTATGALADHAIVSSAAGTVAASGTNTYGASVTPVNGAFAYAWFMSTGGSEGTPRLHSITTTPYQVFVNGTADVNGGTLSGNLAYNTSGYSADNSGDTNAFDGLFPQIVNITHTLSTISTHTSGTLKRATSASGTNYVTNAFVYDMAVGSDYLGTALTADNAGGIVELDLVLKTLWDYARIGPTLILVNSQEALNITKKIGASSALSFRVMLSDGQKDVVGGIYVSGYLNKFSSSLTPGNPDVVPIMIHPYLPPSTMLVLSERLPYPNNEVPNVLEMELQSEYADYEWARTQRKYEHGVYAMGVLKHYFPAGAAIIRGIKNA